MSPIRSMTHIPLEMNALPLLLLSLTVYLGTATAANAQAFQVTLNTPNPTVFRPATGSESYVFSGTVTNLTTDTQIVGDGFTFPFDHSGAFLTGKLTSTPSLPTTFGPNASYSGDLFFLTVTPDTPLGTYDHDSNGNISAFRVDSFDFATGGHSDAAALFTVQVESAPVPEASTTVSFGLLLAVGGLVTIARRNRRNA